jgi:hypothetical protein
MHLGNLINEEQHNGEIGLKIAYEANVYQKYMACLSYNENAYF